MTQENPILLTIQDLKIEGLSEDKWKPIVKGIDLTLAKGEVLGLIGESGAGKSTIGLGAMGFHSYLQSKSVPFASAIAKGINLKIFKLLIFNFLSF